METLLEYYNVTDDGDFGVYKSNGAIDLSVLITGVGMVNTAYYLGKYSNNLFDCVINIGICGALNKNLNIGEVVNVTEDTLSELGAEDGARDIEIIINVT